MIILGQNYTYYLFIKLIHTLLQAPLTAKFLIIPTRWGCKQSDKDERLRIWPKFNIFLIVFWAFLIWNNLGNKENNNRPKRRIPEVSIVIMVIIKNTLFQLFSIFINLYILKEIWFGLCLKPSYLKCRTICMYN